MQFLLFSFWDITENIWNTIEEKTFISQNKMYATIKHWKEKFLIDVWTKIN